MRILALPLRLFAVLAVLGAALDPAPGQVPVAASPAGINTAFVKLFGGVKAFTAKTEARVFDAQQKEAVLMRMDWAVRDGQVRLEINLEDVSGRDFPAGSATTLKQAGMSRIISVFRPEKKATFMIYPGVQSYQVVPLEPAEAAASEKDLKLEKKELGRETLDGHACVKNQVVVKRGQERVLTAVTWNAADLREFPVQIELKEKQNTVRLRFSRIQFAPPAAAQFEVPAGYGLLK